MNEMKYKGLDGLRHFLMWTLTFMKFANVMIKT